MYPLHRYIGIQVSWYPGTQVQKHQTSYCIRLSLLDVSSRVQLPYMLMVAPKTRHCKLSTVDISLQVRLIDVSLSVPTIHRVFCSLFVG